MITIAIVRSSRAFMPETRAYFEYFKSFDEFKPEVVDSYEAAMEMDAFVVVVPYGFVPRWTKSPPVLVADVPSRSTGFSRKMRDRLKGAINHKPDIALFLNDYVAGSGIAKKSTLKIYRSMGYRSELVRDIPRKRDIEAIYAGTLNRPEVMSTLNFLAESGLRISVVGSAGIEGAHPEIDFLGRKSQEETYDIYARSIYGLNIVPDIEPFKFQDSTKLIEYCAMNLRVLSTRYSWVTEFEKLHGARFLFLSNETTKEEIQSFPYKSADVRSLSWTHILAETRLAEEILKISMLRVAGN